MTHPSSLALEAFACGETSDSVTRHLRDCADCSAFVERLRGALSAGPSRARAADVVAAVASKQATPAREIARRRWLMTATSVAVPLAAAAILVLLVRTPSGRETLVPLAPPASVERPSATATSQPSGDITFKGGVQVAVIRERNGQQARFTGRVGVRPGDRLRVEVALDREQDILAAVMGDDASWLELMPSGLRAPGTHFSERSARIDASPLHGTILVGTPEALVRARATRRFDDVTAIRVEWEAP
jgi:hypothetical protein